MLLSASRLGYVTRGLFTIRRGSVQNRRIPCISGSLQYFSLGATNPSFASFAPSRDDSVIDSPHGCPGSIAFGDSAKVQSVIHDLFMSYAHERTTPSGDIVASLGVKDLRDLMIAIGEKPSDKVIEQITSEVDLDGDGMIDLEEFLQGCDKILGVGTTDGDAPIDIDELVDTFRTLDRDGNGVLTHDEIEGLLSATGGRINSEDAKEIFKLADEDGNGEIELSEFIAFVTDPSRSFYAWRLKSGFRVILLIGGPGSGKGILCDRLRERAGIISCSSGDLLRKEVNCGSALGHSIASIIQQGKLIPSTSMIALLKKEIGKFPGALVALDGFPRTLQNYKDFDEICGPPDCAIFIDVPDEVMVERIVSRGKNGSGRSDDNLETALKRIAVFHEKTKPTLEHLHASGIPVHVLDGTGTPEDVWDQLVSLDSPVGRRIRIEQTKTPS